MVHVYKELHAITDLVIGLYYIKAGHPRNFLSPL